MNAQVKFYRQKLQEQEEAYKNKIHSLEREIVRLNARAIDPLYLEGLETHSHNLWTANQDLSKQIDETKLENKNLKDTVAWQQKEIDHISQECKRNGAAIKSVAGVQRGQFNAKNAELREQLDTAREENAGLYEKCIALQQEIDKLKLQYGVATAFSDRLKLVNINKDELAYEEDFATIKKGFTRLHDELNQCIESRTAQQGTMLFETEQVK